MKGREDGYVLNMIKCHSFAFITGELGIEKETVKRKFLMLKMEFWRKHSLGID